MSWHIKERREALGWSRIELASRGAVKVDDVVALEAGAYERVTVEALACVLVALQEAERPSDSSDLLGLARWEA
jgi:ribosome-binding protein aMBF1 (putative translation factor)